MRIAIVGSRKCEGVTVEEIIPHIPLNCSCIVTGGAEGIDCLAAEAARQLQINLEEIKPNYEKYGKAAPRKRNEEIAQRVYLVLVFWDFHSRGTAHMLTYCIQEKIPFRMIGIRASRETL